jgi:hypothetical protein
VNPLTEVYEHNPEDHEDPTHGITWLVGLMGALLLVVIMLGLTALYYNVKAGEIQDHVISRQRDEVVELRRRQEALLAGPPRFIERDEQGRTVTAYIIPIEQAMESVVEQANAAGGE